MPTLFPPQYPYRPDAPLLSFGPSFSEEIARSIIAAVYWDNPDRPHESEVRVAAALTMLEAFYPRDHLECMMAAQGVAAHSMIMDCYRRCMHPDTDEPTAIKIRGNIAQISRTFSTLLHDIERRQSKALPERPPAPPPASGPPPDAPPDDRPGNPPDSSAASTEREEATQKSSGGSPRDLRGLRNEAADNSECRRPDDPWDSDIPTEAELVALSDIPELPEDLETRPDGTPGSLAAYAPKPPPVEDFVPREPAIMWALSTRPKPWRVVNSPSDQSAEHDAMDVAAEAEQPRPTGRGPLEPIERIFTGDQLSRFASARFDPNAPTSPLSFDDDYSEVELELISTGGDLEAEAERRALMAAHPEGKPIKTIRYGSKNPSDE